MPFFRSSIAHAHITNIIVDKKWKMATIDDCTTPCQGQSWISWAQRVGLGVTCDSEDDDKEAATKREGDSMKLRREDMPLFGFCPARDEFYLVVCEVCHQVVKPQALLKHIQLRHSENIIDCGHRELENVENCGKDVGQTRLPPLIVDISATLNTISAATPTISSYIASYSNITVAEEHSARECIIKENSHDENYSLVSRSPPGLKKRHSLSSPIVRVERMPPCIITKASSGFGPQIGDIPGTECVDRKVLQSMDEDPQSPLVADLPIFSANRFNEVVNSKNISTTTSSFSVMPSSFCSSLLCFSQQSSKTNIVSSSTNDGTLKSSIKVKRKEPKERKLLPCKDRVYDPDKHCGVFVQESGKQCTRSLTCKTHSVAMRRNVAGRKKNFDELLADHRATKEAIFRSNKGLAVKLNPRLDGHQTLPSVSSGNVCNLEDITVDATSLHGSSRFVRNHSCSNIGSKYCVAQQRLVSPGIIPVTSKCKGAFLKRSIPLSTLLPSYSSKASDYDSSPEFATNVGILFAGHHHENSKNSFEDCGYVIHHPRPAAVCGFNARQMGTGFYVYNRRLDRIRAVLRTTLGERVPLLSPIKKLCVESRLPPVPEPSDPSDPYCFVIGDQQKTPQRCNNVCVAATTNQLTNTVDTNFVTRNQHVSKSIAQQSSYSLSKVKPNLNCGAVSTANCDSSRSCASSTIETSNHLTNSQKLQSTSLCLHSVSDKTESSFGSSIKRKRGIENKTGRNAFSNNSTSTVLNHAQQHVATVTSVTTSLLPITLSVSLNADLARTVPHLSAANNCSVGSVTVTMPHQNSLPNVLQNHSSADTDISKDAMVTHLGKINGLFFSGTKPNLTRSRLGTACVPVSTGSDVHNDLSGVGVGPTPSGPALVATFASGLNRVCRVTNLTTVVTPNVCEEDHQTIKDIKSSTITNICKVPRISPKTNCYASSNPGWTVLNSKDNHKDLVNISNVGLQSEVAPTNSQLNCSTLSVDSSKLCFASPAMHSKLLVTGNVRTEIHPSSPRKAPALPFNGVCTSAKSTSAFQEIPLVNNLLTRSNVTGCAVNPVRSNVSSCTELLSGNNFPTAVRSKSSKPMILSRELFTKGSEPRDHQETTSAVPLPSTQLNFTIGSSNGFRTPNEFKLFHNAASDSVHYSSSTSNL